MSERKPAKPSEVERKVAQPPRNEAKPSEVDRKAAQPPRNEAKSSEVELEQDPEPRGIHNDRVVDLIRLDSESDEVVLLMLEERAWGTVPEQLRQLEAKFNSYLSYVLDGHLVKQYPQYESKRVRFLLDCATPPGQQEQAMLTSMRNFAISENLGFDVVVSR